MRFPKIRTINTVLYTLSAAIAVATLFVAYLILWPQDVIADWKVVLPDQAIHAGQKVTIQSQYRKLKNVTGTARRYIECTDKDGIFITYPPLNTAEADHAAGNAGTGIVLQLPDNIPNLPTLCRFRIRVEYKLYGFREVSHTVTSSTFTLLPAENRCAAAAVCDPSNESAQAANAAPAASTNATAPSTTTTTTTTTTPQSQSGGASVTLPDLNLDSLVPKIN